MKTPFLNLLCTVGGALIAQSAFAQTPYNTISGTIWKEQGTVNNVKDNGEPGVAGIMVTMLNANSGATVANALTDTSGHYTLSNYQGTGDYILQFDYPVAGFNLVQKRTGGNNTINSSADPATAQTDQFTISAPINLNTFGLGLSAKPNTITYTTVKLSDLTDWNATLMLPKSDSAFGVLTKATIYLNSTELHPYFGVENTSNSAVTTSPNSGIQISVTPPSGAVINVTNSILHTNTPLGAYDGVTDYAGTSGKSWNNEFASVVAPVRIITLANQLNSYRGTGSVNFPTTALGTVTLTGGGNLLSQISTHIGTGLAIVYEYAGGILPVTMPSFTALASNNVVTLDWTTSFEKNNDRFQVERSVDTKDYHSVGEVKSLAKEGNSNALLTYRFVDYGAPDGRVFYRLKQLDKDGSFNYSAVRTVLIGTGNTLNLYPNPASQQVFIESKPGAVLKIYDVSGKLYMQSAFVAAGRQSIDVKKFPAGIYLFQLELDGTTEYQRVNITH